jgi:thiamine-phosphate diphosphorylase
LIDVPIIHAVTDDAILARPDFLARAGDVMSALGRSGAVHLRGRLTGRELLALAVALAELAAVHGSRLIINDRLDIAIAAAAWGAQLGSAALTVRDALAVTRQAGTVIRCGVSVHSAEEAATADGAAWLLAGNVFETASHPDRPGKGLGLLRSIAAMGVPVVAIGGIDPVRAGMVRGVGAHGIAAVSGIWNAPDPAGSARSYLEAMGG